MLGSSRVSADIRASRGLSKPIVWLLIGLPVVATPVDASTAEPPTEATVAAHASSLRATLPLASVALEADPSRAAIALDAVAPPDYLVGDWELRRVRWPRLRLAGGPPPPMRLPGPHDADGIPVRYLGGGRRPVYNPTVLAIDGMRYLHGYRRTRKRIYRQRAAAIADKLDELARIRGKRWQPHKYAHHGLRKGWVNANSHGLVLSFFSRFHRITGNDRRLASAAALMPAFDNRPHQSRWFSTVTPQGHIWYEHWPDGHQKHVLNAHINAIFGLYDYWRETGSPEAEQLIQGGLRTVRARLGRFRRIGKLSRYGLSSDWSSLHYHHVHIDQLSILAKMTGDDWFARKARLLERDEAVWSARRDRRR